MCELVVLLTDPPLTGDMHLDNQRLRRGEVICAVPDGWQWTHGERTNPKWQILQVPGMTLTEGQMLCAEERERERSNARSSVVRHPRARLFRLDLDGLVGQERQGDVLRLETEPLKDRVVKKPPAEDPDVLG